MLRILNRIQQREQNRVVWLNLLIQRQQHRQTLDIYVYFSFLSFFLSFVISDVCHSSQSAFLSSRSLLLSEWYNWKEKSKFSFFFFFFFSLSLCLTEHQQLLLRSLYFIVKPSSTNTHSYTYAFSLSNYFSSSTDPFDCSAKERKKERNKTVCYDHYSSIEWKATKILWPVFVRWKTKHIYNEL